MNDVLLQIITNPQTGQPSSTRTVYFIAMILSAILIICCIPLLFIEALSEIESNYIGIAAILGSASSLLLFAGITKSQSDKFQNKNKNDYEVDK